MQIGPGHETVCSPTVWPVIPALVSCHFLPFQTTALSKPTATQLRELAHDTLDNSPGKCGSDSTFHSEPVHCSAAVRPSGRSPTAMQDAVPGHEIGTPSIPASVGPVTSRQLPACQRSASVPEGLLAPLVLPSATQFAGPAQETVLSESILFTRIDVQDLPFH